MKTEMTSREKLIQRWKRGKSSRPYRLDALDARKITFEAYKEGFINWNVYQKVLSRIKTNMNGTWMFNKEKL